MREDTRTNAPTVKDLSSIAAENNPGETAFGEGVTGPEVTWAEFDSRSARAANGFREYAGQGDRIAFLCEGSIDHTTLWNGALKAGCVVSNLHTRGSPDTIRYCLDELAPQVLVLDEAFADAYRDDIAEGGSGSVDAVVTIGDAQIESAESAASFVSDRPETPPDVSIGQRDLAAVMWTSGTTGMPKGWCFTNRGLTERGMKILSAGTQRRRSRRLQGLTPSFAAWYSGIVPALLANAATYFLGEWDPQRYLRAIEERRITSVTLVPTMWQEVLRLDDFGDYDLSSLQVAGAAGERLAVDTVRALRENVCDRVMNSYSATEAVVTTILYDDESAGLIEELGGTVGKPAPGTRVRIVAPDGPPDDEMPPGEVGEVIVRTSDHPVWAWNDTRRSADAFVDGWWYSGDLGYQDEDGYLYLEGRKDFVIMSKGIKVHPDPIEERLDEHPGVAESAVVGVRDDEFGEQVTAVVSVSDETVTADDLDQWCLDDDSIARFERPREYRIVSEPLPKTVTGKLDRASTMDRLLDAGN